MYLFSANFFLNLNPTQCIKYDSISFLQMIVADVYNHRFYKVFERRDALSHINDKDVIYV